MKDSVINTQTHTPKNKNIKGVIIVLVLLLLGLCAIVGSVALGLYSFNNDKQIPIISDAIYAVYKSTGHPKTVSDTVKTESNTLIGGLLTPLLEKNSADMTELNINPENKIESLKFDSLINVSKIPITDPTFNIENMEMEIRGSFDQSNIDNIKFDSIFNINITISGLMLEISGKIVYIDNNLYIKFTKIPSILSMYIDLSKIDNQWVKIDKATLNELSDTDTSANIDYSLTQEDIQSWKSFQDLMTNNTMFSKNAKKLPAEDIEGNSSFCISENVDRQLLSRQFEDAQTFVQQLTGDRSFDQNQKDQIAKSLKNMDLYTEACVNEKTFRIHRVKIIVTGDINYDVNTKIWDYNKSNNITAPDSYMNINELGDLLQGLNDTTN